MSNQETLASLVREAAESGTFFTVEFVKKDGTLRKMTCRGGVKKGVKGVGRNWDPEARGFVTVYDMAKLAFRLVNTKTLRSLKWRGEEYVLSE